MLKEVLEKESKTWMKPEEAITAIKKRQEAGKMLTGAEQEQLRYLENALKEQEKAELEYTRKMQNKTPAAESPEVTDLRKKADAAREEEKRKFQGGQYL